jgi:hypothetical protein
VLVAVVNVGAFFQGLLHFHHVSFQCPVAQLLHDNINKQN